MTDPTPRWCICCGTEHPRAAACDPETARGYAAYLLEKVGFRGDFRG